MAAQTWNNILSYIKIELGAKYNLLEYTDDEIVDALKDHVLTKFSQYSPWNNYAFMTSANRLASGSGEPLNKYRIPVPEGTQIIDILDVYFPDNSNIISDYGDYIANPGQAMDFVMSNTFMDALRSLQTRQTWEFITPDILIFDLELSGAATVVYNTNHLAPSTIRPDLYNNIFKDMCLAKVKIWISALRNKFEQLATPVATININWEKLESDGRELWTKCEESLSILPPDHLVVVSV